MNNGMAVNPAAMNESLNQYFSKKNNNDIDLISEVRNLLISVGLIYKISNYDNHKFIVSAVDKASEVQRYYLNRYWSEQLMQCSASTTDVRYYLIPDGEISYWLELFKDKILPYVLENNLPI
jgi:hypothetical protein